MSKIVLDKVAFIAPPVSFELKRRLNVAGYRVIDIEYAPPGFKNDAGVEALLAGLQPQSKAPPTLVANPPKTPAQPAASGGNAHEQGQGNGKGANTDYSEQEKTAETEAARTESAETGTQNDDLNRQDIVDDEPLLSFDNMSMEQLREAYEAKFGSKAAWNINQDTLIARLKS